MRASGMRLVARVERPGLDGLGMLRSELVVVSLVWCLLLVLASLLRSLYKLACGFI